MVRIRIDTVLDNEPHKIIKAKVLWKTGKTWSRRFGANIFSYAEGSPTFIMIAGDAEANLVGLNYIDTLNIEENNIPTSISDLKMIGLFYSLLNTSLRKQMKNYLFLTPKEKLVKLEL